MVSFRSGPTDLPAGRAGAAGRSMAGESAGAKEGAPGMLEAMSEPRAPDVSAFVAAAPGDAEWARRAVEPYAGMAPADRLRALSALNAWIDALLAGRLPEREDGERPFWMHWKDPALGGRG